MTIILDINFVAFNQYLNSERIKLGRGKYGNTLGAKIKKQQTELVANCVKSQGIKPLPKGKYNVWFEWIKPNNRKDHDNISFSQKFIFDGLQDAGILEDDSPKFINSLIHTFELDKSQNYVSCIVHFLEVGKKLEINL